ncbi:LacI family DNA-binding transcriptional regulator [Actinoplanes sp. RD1]|uniref:LacI family DNA-binding transcriptional regulator n=1 Tax=Actinoplanes sp. RD1 TaxID=3064538 RepID=UPI0027412530|nr:substrate-binding domain-containing protein [Actinoplanes sp. RD1]
MTTTRTTLAEIAAEAGVAVSTVSKVLNGHSDVAAATRVRIERLLARRGYRRSPAARRPDRTGLIDLVIDEPDSPWGLAVLGGVAETAEESGLGVLVSARSADTLLPRGSQGAVLAVSALTDRQRTGLDRRSIPFVLVDGAGQAHRDAPSIGATDFAGGYAATEHLITLGHRRIGMIGGPDHLPHARARTAGYGAALSAAGLPADAGLIRTGDLTHAGGQAAAAALLALPDPPTAVFAADDLQAGGVYEAVRQSGRTVPGDLSVVGFGDLPYARWLAPPLTTVRQPLHEMGVTATRTLLRLLNEERLESPRVELATVLVTRASTAPLTR